jgi:hypothetical protein
MSRHSKPPAALVTKAAYAKLRGIDASLLTRRIADGMIAVVGPKELIDIAKADAALVDALGTAGRLAPRKRGSRAARPGSGRRSPKPGGLTLHDARTARSHVEVERAKIAQQREAMELAKLRGELVEIAAVAQVVSEEYAAVRSKLLALPGKLAPQLAATSTAPECMALLTDGIIAALRELSADTVTSEADKEGAR